MSLRRYVSLMHGLGYTTAPSRSSVPPPTSQDAVRRLPRGMVRYAPGVNDG